MRGRPGSLARRVAAVALISAVAAGAATAVVTNIAAGRLLRWADDRRLREAGRVLAAEVVEHPRQLKKEVADEQKEMAPSGIRFAVFDARKRFVAGQWPSEPVAAGTCTDAMRGASAIRACGLAAGRRVVVSSAERQHDRSLALFGIASLIATVVAAFGGLLASRRLARWAIAPLARLRRAVAAVDSDAPSGALLGGPEQVIEVDELRAAIGGLLERLGGALQQASRFAADSAHELRTPLTKLRGELELLEEDPGLDGALLPQVRRARTVVDQLATLVERLLILALPAGGDAQIREWVSMRDVVTDVIAGLPAEQRERVAVEPGDRDPCELAGEPALLEALVKNAIGNALKFGRRRVEVRLAQTEDAIVLQVDDDGPGVAPAERARVFEPFHRGAGASPVTRGHGIGLALIAHVARAHRGSARFADGAFGARLEVMLARRRADGAAARPA